MASREWQTVVLGDVLTPVKRPVSLTASEEYRTLGVRWYGNGPFAKPAIPGAKIAAKTLNEVRTEDIVYSKLFAWKGSFGYVSPELDGVVASNEFPTYTADETRLVPAFFALWSSRPQVWDEAELASTGTTANSRNRLAPDDFLDLEIELPPVKEQHDILAAVARVQAAEQAHLDVADASFRLLAAAREELLVTDQAWDELPDGWCGQKLAEVADIRSGITKGRRADGPLIETPFIRAANVQDGFLDLDEIKTLAVSPAEVERFGLRAGDVLMTEGGNAEHVGRGWVWEDQVSPAVCQNHVFRVRVDASIMNPRFLGYAISASPARAYCLDSAKKTTNLASINKSQVSDLTVPVPPMDMQDLIVARLDLLRSKSIVEQRASQRLRELRLSVTDGLLSGAVQLTEGL